MLIGTFKKTETGSFRGTIRTLTLNHEVEFEPITDRKGEKMPDFRIKAGDSDIGGAWKKESANGSAYLSGNIDDPALPAPIWCALVKTGIEHGYSLVWERKRKPRAGSTSSEF